MRASWISTSFVGSFLITAFCLQWWQRTIYPAQLHLLLGFVGLFGLLGLLKRKTRALSGYTLAATIGTALAFSAIAHNTHVTTSTSIEYHANEVTVSIRGTIIGEPRGRLPGAQYPVEVEELTSSGTIFHPVTGRVLVQDIGGWPTYRIGDHIEVSGTLKRPGKIEDFDYDQYLMLDGITATMDRAMILPLRRSTPNVQRLTVLSVRRILQSLKNTFEHRINRLFPEPSASLMRGLLTGSRRGFSQKLLDDFNTTSLTHLIAISGTNVTIVIVILGGLFFWLPLKWRFFPQVTAIILFTLFVGASASVVRAAIMGILGLLALETGRIKDTRLAILWTAFAMTLWKPEQLWWDAGFHLSFAAVIGIAEVGSHMQRWLKRVPEFLGLRESLAATLSAQITTTPLIAFTFGRISLIATLSNILAAPVVPLAMLIGFVGTIVSIVSFPLGQLIAFPGFGMTQWIIGVASVLSKIPFASVSI